MDTPAVTALVLGTAVKVLLWPAYHSTDMEVHRNWLAITYSLPLRDWYVDATSPWTLDYPPFFAYLSWALAQPAAWVDPRMVDVVRGLDYAAWPCKAYMRLTVLVTELVLAAALYAHYTCARGDSTQRILLLSVLMHPGLVIVDHIHFQYNGMLFGVLLWALWAARTHRPLLCAVLFASLLNLKHIYLYVAPAFAVYLLRTYLVPAAPRSIASIRSALLRAVCLGTATLMPFVLGILPFFFDAARAGRCPIRVLNAMHARLFPFHRGLIHAYWAPNVWALYAAADRVLQRLWGQVPLASASRGIVGNTAFGVLPDVRPPVCFALALAAALVYVGPLWQRPTYHNLVVCVSLCALSSFAVGWHVHEKAILLAALPLSLAASHSYAYLRVFEVLTAVSIVALFPLLFTHLETPIKLLYAAIWCVIVRQALVRRVLRPMPTNLGILIHAAESLYMQGLVALALATNVAWPLAKGVAPHLASPKVEFLPLLLTSVYCAAGVVYVWGRLTWLYVVGAPGTKQE